MRKKSHLSLARYLLCSTKEEFAENSQHKKSFYFGNLLPDISPSFLYRKHNIDDTFDAIMSELHKLFEDYAVATNMFWMHLGVITHYLADYCTFPHNDIFHGSLREHCAYERDLKYALRSYVHSRITRTIKPIDIEVNSVEDIYEIIRLLHNEYLSAKKKVDVDCTYIVEMCRQVITAICTFKATESLAFSMS